MNVVNIELIAKWLIYPIEVFCEIQALNKEILHAVSKVVRLTPLPLHYDQNTIFSFVEFPYEGKKLAAYAEEMPTTIYLHMETLTKGWS